MIDTGKRGGVSLGDISFADYAMKHTAGWWTNKRMPATDTNVQAAIMCRKGRSDDAVADAHGCLSVSGDISQSTTSIPGRSRASGRFVINTLVGDLILVQPDAYAERWHSGFRSNRARGFLLGFPLVAAGRLVAWLPPGWPAATPTRSSPVADDVERYLSEDEVRAEGRRCLASRSGTATPRNPTVNDSSRAAFAWTMP